MTTLNSGQAASGSGWLVIARTMLRTIFNDSGGATYTDSRMNELLITAAYWLPIDINFSTSYTVDLIAETISPDPTGTSDGQEFINFMVLKAACILDEGNFRNNALLQGVKARCGPAILETSSYGQYLKEFLTKGPCGTYEDLKMAYNFSGEGGKILRAVMSPFVSNDFQTPMGTAVNGQLDTNNYHRNRNSY